MNQRRTAPSVPLYESPRLEEILRDMKADPAAAATVREFAENGLVVIDAGVAAEVADRIVGRLEPRYGADRRLLNAWLFDRDVRELAVDESILGTIRLLYGREPIPFQTLNFNVGTEQATHSDTMHFNTLPAGFMCGAWIALEAIDERNGALHYYPGSHKLPVYEMTDLGLPAGPASYRDYERRVAELLPSLGYERKILRLEPGQAVIWAANLFHGGSPILEPGSSRHSQVTHYFFEGCVYYTPIGSDPAAGHYQHRNFRDIKTGKPVAHHLNGRRVTRRRFPFLPVPLELVLQELRLRWRGRVK